MSIDVARGSHVRLISSRPPPLYDPSTEHDACGVGFVADAGGRSALRILPLALAGLASLGHRGAFAADGLSSDGAGVALPLETALVERLTADVPLRVRAAIGRRPGVLQLFLPRNRAARARADAVVAAALAEAGLAVAARRRVPVDLAALGPAALDARPAFEQAFIARPPDASGRTLSDAAFERRLLLVRRRIAGDTSRAGSALRDLAVASGSCRTIVYKGLVTGDRLAQLYPDLAGPVPVTFATFHQRYATNTHPTWRLAQPFGHLAHNGEINTVRGNREEVRGRRADPDPSGLLDDLVQRGPLLGVDGSDSASLDEAVELLVASGWSVGAALVALLPAAPALRADGSPGSVALARRTAGFLAPWDGPAALVFTDGRTVGALLDRNGLRPLAYAITRDGVVAAASEAGAVPLDPAETETLARLGPGEMLLVDPGRRQVLSDAEARRRLMSSRATHDRPRPAFRDEPSALRTDAGPGELSPGRRYLAGLDAERLRLDLRTMILDGHEPLWSMGDDTPTPGLGRVPRRTADHLKQAFAQVTNPPIDPERERLVVDLRVNVGRRAPLLGGLPRGGRSVRLARPIVADLDGLCSSVRRLRAGPVVAVDATWAADAGPDGLAAALTRIAAEAVAAADRGAVAILLTDRGFDDRRLPVPSVLAVGAAHAALTDAGRRGRTDIVAEAADVLDVHALAMTLAAGARVVHPWLAIRVAAETAGTRGAEALDVAGAVASLLDAFEAGLRKTLARMGISAVASYVGGALFETLDLAPEVTARCFPAALGWEGTVGFADLGARQLARRDAGVAIDAPGVSADMGGNGARAASAIASVAREPRLPDPGLARFRADGELHLFAPRIVAAIQTLAADGAAAPGALPAYRASLDRPAPALVRDRLALRPRARRRAIGLDEVEPARAIARRLVVSAMSVGALSPEAHQVLTIGIQRAGGAANTGEGGEDPAWYTPGDDGRRRDAAIKQVASGRFGVTATYLARAEQLEIKIAQGSKPGEGGQLPAKKATAYIAALRRGQAGRAYISPPPHHDIYSIEDLAQLIADLRAINPAARIGVKLVASRGVGTVAAGVAKAGADYIHLAGGAGGTGASPLSSIKHVGVPWELGLSEVHQVLLWNDLRDRVALRTDGGLQRGRDLLVAALLGAEEFALGTAALIAIGCDMARQCHLDTCPTGIASQRADLRAKFTGTPEQVERFALALAEDLRGELAAIGARSVGEIVGEAATYLQPVDGLDPGLRRVISAPRWAAGASRRADPAAAGAGVQRLAASPLEHRLVSALRGHGDVRLDGLRISTAERSFGAALTGEVERGAIRVPLAVSLRGSAGQSFGAFLGAGLELRLAGTANDYVAKGLAGGTVVVAPDPSLRAAGRATGATGTTGAAGAAGTGAPSLAGNTCLYGATGGRLHVVGRAGMRFAVRNAGADAVVEGIGPHGAEYMTGGTLLVLGGIGPNFGAGMTGGRAYILDPSGAVRARIDPTSVSARPLRDALLSDDAAEIGRLLRLHRDAGSVLAATLLEDEPSALRSFWAVEPVVIAPEQAVDVSMEPAASRPAAPIAIPALATGTQPIRSHGAIAAGV
ncbi:MAG TPA: glutamate synthase large subunit [Candidatus Sulfomarinibacteraceae bacterium]|nr:glutamate synthase large subunit [Candidatus Sulfomarinibacteraceae bacterium]